MKRFGVSAVTGTIFLVAAFILVALAVETTPETILNPIYRQVDISKIGPDLAKAAGWAGVEMNPTLLKLCPRLLGGWTSE